MHIHKQARALFGQFKFEFLLTDSIRVKCLSFVCSFRPLPMQIEAISMPMVGRGWPVF